MSKYKLPKRRIEGKTINTISSAYHQLQNTIHKKEKKKKLGNNKLEQNISQV